MAPVAGFTYAPANPTRQTNVQFTDASTAQAHCPITSWSWNFGDGTATSSAQNPVHRYNYGGSAASQQFTVILTVTNVAGSSTTSQVITVTR